MGKVGSFLAEVSAETGQVRAILVSWSVFSGS